MSLTSNKDNILREVGLAFSEGVRKAIMGEGFSPVNISLRASVPTPRGTLVRASHGYYPESGYECTVYYEPGRHVDHPDLAAKVMAHLPIGLYRKDLPPEQKQRYLRPEGQGMTFTVEIPFRKCKVTVLYDRIVGTVRKSITGSKRRA